MLADGSRGLLLVFSEEIFTEPARSVLTEAISAASDRKQQI